MRVAMRFGHVRPQGIDITKPPLVFVLVHHEYLAMAALADIDREAAGERAATACHILIPPAAWDDARATCSIA
jgi:hypothetical protein